MGPTLGGKFACFGRPMRKLSQMEGPCSKLMPMANFRGGSKICMPRGGGPSAQGGGGTRGQICSVGRGNRIRAPSPQMDQRANALTNNEARCLASATPRPPFGLGARADTGIRGPPVVRASGTERGPWSQYICWQSPPSWTGRSLWTVLGTPKIKSFLPPLCAECFGFWTML